ncbi:MAG: NUDIX hydrolase [Candidatus Bathyarchaeia archaeon]
MQREYPKHPLVGVGAVIKKKGYVLLVKRRYDPGKGLWSIPGGLVELGETVQEAVKREVREETGLEVEVIKLIDVVDNIIKDDQKKVKFHYVLIDFLVSVKGGKCKPTSNASEIKWFKPHELTDYEVTNTAINLLKKIGFIE